MVFFIKTPYTDTISGQTCKLKSNQIKIDLSYDKINYSSVPRKTQHIASTMPGPAQQLHRRDEFHREEALMDAYANARNYINTLPVEIVIDIVRRAKITRGEYCIVKAGNADAYMSLSYLRSRDLHSISNVINWRFLTRAMHYASIPALYEHETGGLDTSGLFLKLEATGIFRYKPMRWYTANKGREVDHQVIVYESDKVDAENVRASLAAILGHWNMKYVHIQPCHTGPPYTPGPCVGMQVFFMGRLVDADAIKNDIIFQAYNKFVGKEDIRITALNTRQAGYTLWI